MYKQISTNVPILFIFDRIFKQNFNCDDKLVQNIDWRYVPQCVLKNATEYHRIFNNKPIVKSNEDDIVVIETSLKRL